MAISTWEQERTVKMAKIAENMGRREKILEATLGLLKSGYLTDWTVDMVAERAKCAKGLVIYHFATKSQLLLAATAAIRGARLDSRTQAVRGDPAAALDRLWQQLVQEVTGGEFALWVGLLGHREAGHLARDAGPGQQQFVAAIASTFRLPANHPLVQALPAVLDGLQVQLLQGVAESVVREAYDAIWLGVIDMASTG